MVTIDLIGQNAVEIGATYKASFKLCGYPDLSGYTGSCQIKHSNTSNIAVLTPTINIITNDIFSIDINFGDYPPDLAAGKYQYDTLFSSNSVKFYAVGGYVEIVRRTTV